MARNFKGEIDGIVARRNAAHRFYSQNSEVYRAFIEMERKTYTDRKLSKMHKELIAIGISVVINCESCMEWHIRQAAKAGASVKEVLEAIEVGIEMGGGPATVSARFALDVMQDVFGSMPDG